MMGVAISNDFKDDEKGALKALKNSKIAVFYVSEKWFDDKRAQREWRYAKQLKKPMIYIFKNTRKLSRTTNIGFLWEGVNLIATINDYGDVKKNAEYLKAIIRCYVRCGI